MSREPKGAPIVIRLSAELDRWVRAEGERLGNRNAVIEQAVRKLYETQEDQTELIHQTIVGHK